MRRAGDIPGITAGYVAYLSLLRTPSAAEQILPFCVLFGAMAAFLNLTRKLELLVARAAGVSVWQFLIPPVLIALGIGLVSVGAYNPVSAAMKRQADGIELKLFARNTTPAGTAVWLRQKSVDGEAIIHADASSDGGTRLSGVTAFIYDEDGRLAQRVDADSGRLLPGVWELQDVRVSTPGEARQDAGTYLLATDLQADQVAQSFAKPDSVPFWELPGLRARTETAGLDATGYRLQFQTLLARPLLLVAMVLVAAAFSLRFFRFGGIAVMVGGGVAAGFVLYTATKFVGDLGGAGVLSAPLAAWAPAVVANMLGALALLHQEDG
jgi:lipopolysaccharide export system permease protein